MSEESYAKLAALKNDKVSEFIGTFVEHCDPASVYVCTDSEQDIQYVRDQALAKGEEQRLANSKQTIHWDGYGDQARDKINTRYLVYDENLERMGSLNSIKYEEGYQEIMEISKGIMHGKDAVVQFFSEGPAGGPFTIPCIQFTDSWYVAHSEFILYRSAYNHFLEMKDAEKGEFFRFVHSAGVLDENNNSVNIDKRRIYMDTQNNIVYSMNDQYAGNSVGMKKHSMRLAINKSGREGWLCEHMFVMAAIDADKNRKTYFCGAYPSACGKTSTAMIPGEQIVGDDIAYFRNIDGDFRAVNVEFGMFGIIKDVNAKDDPVIFANLMKDQEVIFSNVLKGPDGKPYWSAWVLTHRRKAATISARGRKASKIKTAIQLASRTQTRVHHAPGLSGQHRQERLRSQGRRTGRGYPVWRPRQRHDGPHRRIAPAGKTAF
jgi:phosphoenolpyruvate carboxykinase (GTP)